MSHKLPEMSAHEPLLTVTKQRAQPHLGPIQKLSTPLTKHTKTFQIQVLSWP